MQPEAQFTDVWLNISQPSKIAEDDNQNSFVYC